MFPRGIFIRGLVILFLIAAFADQVKVGDVIAATFSNGDGMVHLCITGECSVAVATQTIGFMKQINLQLRRGLPSVFSGLVTPRAFGLATWIGMVPRAIPLAFTDPAGLAITPVGLVTPECFVEEIGLLTLSAGACCFHGWRTNRHQQKTPPSGGEGRIKRC